MDYTYRKLDSFGDTFFRILQRRNSDDSWQVVTGTFDVNKEDDARRTVQELAANHNGYIVTEPPDESTHLTVPDNVINKQRDLSMGSEGPGRNIDCYHITLIRQTGPMDGGLTSKRYVCRECGKSFSECPASSPE